MDDYQKEHAEAYRMVQSKLDSMSVASRSVLKATLSEYLEFRKNVDAFLETHFKSLCTNTCFQNSRSACCTREGIIVYFADVVVNCILSDPDRIDSLINVLGRPNTGFKCVYLSEKGCLWSIKPIVCQMFLCTRAEREVLDGDAGIRNQWENLNTVRKRFTWPDRQVLFDDLECFFIDAGFDSPLMYFHKSPGLLAIKRQSGVPGSKGIHQIQGKSKKSASRPL